MTLVAVEAHGLSKRYRIAAPDAPALADYVRRPGWALRHPRRMAVEALQDVSFSVDEGEVFGIIGRNGAGKSTLLKILSRITAPTSGRARLRGRLASLLEVGTGFHPELTGRENIYLNGMLLGMQRREVDRVLDEICEFAGVGPYLGVPIKRYSSGMQLRLAFAVAAHLAADTMIVDEVLAVGDAEFQAKCQRTMADAAERGRTTLFVSHNMAAVEHLCSRVLWLERGRVRGVGPASDLVRQYLRGVTSGAAARSGYSAPEDSAPRAPVRIVRAALTSLQHGAPGEGERIAIELELRARQRVRGLQLSVSLSTLDGVQVCWLSNADYRDEWDLEAGTYRVHVALDDARLLPRPHAVSLRTFTGWGHETFEHIENAFTFTLGERDVLGHGIALKADRGITWVPATFRLEPVLEPAEVDRLTYVER